MHRDFFTATARTALVAETIYILWLPFHIKGPAGSVYYALELSLCLLFYLFLFNHAHRRYTLSGGTYSLRSFVDVFIPTVNESVSTLRRTITAATQIWYPNKTIYVLDDSGRAAVQHLAEQLGCTYLHRPDARTKRFKAANLNYGLHHSQGAYIITIDADHSVRPEIVDDLLGHFKDPAVAFVATRQGFAVPEGSFNHDHTFYEYMQSGKQANNAAISCGSGVIYRRSALKAISGFQEWNLVEDLYTSFVFHTHGFRSVYSGQRYSRGHAPEDLPTICKQRWVWAYDTMRLFVWRFPIWQRGLTFRQRLHYFEIGYGYIVSALTVPGLALFNTWVLLQNVDIITQWGLFFVLKVASFCLILRFYAQLDQGTQSSRMWAALFLVYASACLRALWYPKPLYKPTPKHRSKRPPWIYTVPHLVLLTLLSIALAVHLYRFGFTVLVSIHLFWFAILLYWFAPIIQKAWTIR